MKYSRFLTIHEQKDVHRLKADAGIYTNEQLAELMIKDLLRAFVPSTNQDKGRASGPSCVSGGKGINFSLVGS